MPTHLHGDTAPHDPLSFFLLSSNPLPSMFVSCPSLSCISISCFVLNASGPPTSLYVLPLAPFLRSLPPSLQRSFPNCHRLMAMPLMAMRPIDQETGPLHRANATMLSLARSFLSQYLSTLSRFVSCLSPPLREEEGGGGRDWREGLEERERKVVSRRGRNLLGHPFRCWLGGINVIR